MMEENLIGWQKQPNKLNIQGEIERAIGEIVGEEVNLIASGRTDSGVHAFGQVANFKTENDKFPISEAICGEGLSLPMHTELDDEQILRITTAVKEFFG